MSRVILENVKDRLVTIFGIYLKLSNNLYIVIEDFGHKPLILKGFETYQQDYEPMEFYSVGTRRITIDKLLRDRKIKKRLVVSTSDGKYTVRHHVPKWDPVYEFFRNHMTAIVHPIRSTFKGKAYGSNALFVVELKFENGADQVVRIYQRDYESRRFRRFALTPESLESKEALELFLNHQRERGNLAAKSITVHDLRSKREEIFGLQRAKTIEVRPAKAIEYYLLGYLSTRISDWRVRRENTKRAKQRQQGS